MDFSVFLKMHPPDSISGNQVIIPEQIKIDKDLESFLSLVKINSFSNGFLWTINQNDLINLFPVWDWTDKNTFIILRTAFGGLLYKKKTTYFFFDPQTGKHVNLTDDLSFVLNIAICDKRSLNTTFLFDVFKEGTRLKGLLQGDECFAFVPALKLGGSKNAENLEIVKLKEHLLFLSQL